MCSKRRDGTLPDGASRRKTGHEALVPWLIWRVQPASRTQQLSEEKCHDHADARFRNRPAPDQHGPHAPRSWRPAASPCSRPGWAAARRPRSCNLSRAAASRSGPINGIACYTNDAAGSRLVATLSSGEGSTPVRVVATLASGQSVTLSVPHGVGEPATTVTFSRQGEHVFVNDRAALVEAVK